MTATRSPADVLFELVPTSGRAIVDVGCGEGALVRRLAAAGADVVGVDTQADVLARARAHEPVRGERYLEGSGQRLPLPDASADAVLFVHSLHHVPVELMDAALAEAARVVRPGRAVYVQEPVAEGTYFELVRAVDDETRVRAAAQDALGRAGAHGLRLERELRFGAPVRFTSFDALRERLVLADPARAERFTELEARLRAAYDELAGPDGAAELVGPTLVTLLRRRDG